MPPKITDSRPSPDAIQAFEEQTASGARRVVATYAEDFFDGVTLMSMLGIEPDGFSYKKYAQEREAGETAEEEPKKAAAKKTPAKKAPAKKAPAKKAAVKKAPAKKAAVKKTPAKKATAKKTTKKTATKSSTKPPTGDES